MPLDWGAHFALWVNTMAAAYPWLEKVYLKAEAHVRLRRRSDFLVWFSFLVFLAFLIFLIF
jgi:hypothetical protein